MPMVKFICQYCDKMWTRQVYNKDFMQDEKCPRCQDSNLKVEELDETKGDVFGYGSGSRADAYLKKK